MVFGLKKMQDELFCMTEERNYFQGKYLEQVSEIVALKEELRKARREILKIRGELMESSSTTLFAEDSVQDSSEFQTPTKTNRRQSRRVSCAISEEHQEEKKESDNLDEHGESGEQEETDVTDDHDDENDDHDDEEDTEAADIRQSAEKLLQWASYRSYARTSSTNSPDHGSVASGSQQASLLDDSSASLLVPRTIDSPPLDFNKSLSHDSGAPSPTAADSC